MKALVQREGAPARLSDDHFHLALLIGMAAVMAALVLSFALMLHRNFLTIACDTAVLQSAIVNTLHGHWFANNGAGGPNVLGSHTTFLLLAVIPFYVVAPYPETLFALQVIGTYSTVIPLYLVARELTQRPLIAFIVATLALVSPMLLHMALAPFHLETWIAAAALWAYFFYRRNNLPGFLVALLVAVTCGEQAALIAIALGLSLLLVEDGCAWRRRFGAFSLAGGLLWLVLAVGVITPYAGGSHPFNIFAYNYTEWGVKSAAGLPGALLHHPGMAVGLALNPYRWDHILLVVGLPLLTAFCSWRTVILLAPAPAYLLMSDQEFYLYFHAYYYSFAFFAGYLGLMLVLARLQPGGRATLALLAALFLSNIIACSFASGFYYQLSGGVDEDFSQTLREQFARIPPSATVYTPHRYSVYLSNRDNYVIGDLREANLDFNAMIQGRLAETNVRPEQIDYIVSDFLTDQCGWRNGFLSAEQFKNRADAIQRLVDSGNWKVDWQQDNVVILQRARR